MKKIATTGAQCVLIVSMMGCATFERDTTARFTMLTESQWTMESLTRHYSKPDDPKGEAERLAWLEGYTKNNGCKSYSITTRAWTKSDSSMVPQGTGKLVYTGTCLR